MLALLTTTMTTTTTNLVLAPHYITPNRQLLAPLTVTTNSLVLVTVTFTITTTSYGGTHETHNTRKLLALKNPA